MSKTKELEKTKKNDVKSLVESNNFKSAIKQALPKHLSPDRFIRIACTALTRTPKLMECNQLSLFNALLTLSQLGLEPDGRRAHLIPFENRSKNIVECQLIIDYKGLAELAYNTNKVSYIHADVICEKDKFIANKGEIVNHVIDYKSPRGKVYAAYAIVRFKDSTEKSEIMTKIEIDAIKERSKAKNSGPWVTDYNEMAKKTVFRRLSKWIPLSPEQRDALDSDLNEFEDIPLNIIPIENSSTGVKPGSGENDDSKANTALGDQEDNTINLYDPGKCDPCTNRKICKRLDDPAQIDKCKGIYDK